MKFPPKPMNDNRRVSVTPRASGFNGGCIWQALPSAQAVFLDGTCLIVAYQLTHWDDVEEDEMVDRIEAEAELRVDDWQKLKNEDEAVEFDVFYKGSRRRVALARTYVNAAFFQERLH